LENLTNSLNLFQQELKCSNNEQHNISGVAVKVTITPFENNQFDLKTQKAQLQK
jgi:hypothetical protein